MTSVDIEVAGNQLVELVGLAAAGEEIVIARDGKPVARLVAVPQERPIRRLGLAAGRFAIPDEETLGLDEEVAKLFEGV